MSFSTEMQDVASELLAEFGGPITLVRPGVITADVTKPWRTNTVGSPTSYAVTGVLVDYNVREIDGTAIRSGDKKCLLSGADIAVPPRPRDYVDQGGIRYYVQRVEVIDPAGVDILYTLQLRAGPTDDAVDGEGERRDVNFN